MVLKDELVKLLGEEDDVLKKNLQVSIVGPGGLGKTTLANQVYNTIGGNFKHRAFVSVSQNPNMMNVLRDIHRQVIIPRFIDEPKEQLRESAPNMLHELRWIAEGFIPQERGYTPYEIGERCFLELINRPLIQPVKTNAFGEVKTCQVHDIIIDSIVSKSIEDNFVTIYVTVFENFVKLPPLLEFKILRVLDIEGCDLSEEHHRLAAIGMLSQLKEIRWITVLRNIESKGNKITELPASIVQISQLINLLIDGEVKLPDKIGDMLSLQELRLINVLKQSDNFWQELSKLTNLRDMSLSLESDGANDAERWNVCTENMVSSAIREQDVSILGSIPALVRLVLYVQNEQEKQQQQQQKKREIKDKKKSKEKKTDKEEDVEEGEMSEQLEKLENLKDKKMIMMKEEERNNEELEGRTRKRREEHDTNAATGLSSNSRRRQPKQEQDVSPKRRTSNRGQLKISVSHGFQCLRYLKIDGTDPRVLGLEFGAGSMPNLEELVLMFKAARKFDETNEDFFFGINNLSHLVSITCEIDCFPEPEIMAEELEDTIRRAVRMHPNNPRLHIYKRSL
uniref:Uncharacterized protein n=1 Tax=Leersia perrieri TaxID=77586 RepID=A0A0D9XSG7_9ORYZ